MSDKIELLPCPFCGGEAVAERVRGARLTLIHCKQNLQCGSVIRSTKALAIAAWNTRPTQASIGGGDDLSERLSAIALFLHSAGRVNAARDVRRAIALLSSPTPLSGGVEEEARTELIALEQQTLILALEDAAEHDTRVQDRPNSTANEIQAATERRLAARAAIQRALLSNTQPATDQSALIGELVEAGEPFAAALAEWGEDAEHPDMRNIWEHPLAMCITLGDFRRFAKALAAAKQAMNEKGSQGNMSEEMVG